MPLRNVLSFWPRSLKKNKSNETRLLTPMYDEVLENDSSQGWRYDFQEREEHSLFVFAYSNLTSSFLFLSTCQQ